VENTVESLSRVKNGQKHFKAKLQEEQKKLAQLNTSAEATRVEFEVISVERYHFTLFILDYRD
jgi:hypothetical protein